MPRVICHINECKWWTVSYGNLHPPSCSRCTCEDIHISSEPYLGGSIIPVCQQFEKGDKDE